MRTTIGLAVFLALLLTPAHTVVRKVDAKEGPRIDTVAHTELRIQRAGSVIEVISDSKTRETPEGTILRIESRSKMSGQEQTTVYTFQGRQVKLAGTPGDQAAHGRPGRCHGQGRGGPVVHDRLRPGALTSWRDPPMVTTGPRPSGFA